MFPWHEDIAAGAGRIGIGPVLLLITETIFVGLLVVGLIYRLRA